MRWIIHRFHNFFLLLTILPFSLQAQSWHSLLYPTNWQPGFRDSQGRFLHDFSYAGYRNAEVRIPNNPPGLIYNVFTGFGADPYGTFDSTPEIQAAINAATNAGGGIVYFPPGYYRINGELNILSSKVVLRGAGIEQTKLRFSSTVERKPHIGFYGNLSYGTHLALTQDAPILSTVVQISNASSLRVGDDVALGWVATDQFIAEHAMTGTWTVSKNIWWPFFQRKVVAVNTRTIPHQVTLDIPLRYPAKTRDFASLRKVAGYLEEVGVEHLSISNVTSYKTAWSATRIRAINFDGVKNSWIRNVNSFSPPEDHTRLFHLQSGGIRIENSKAVTVANSQMEGSQNRGNGSNGYLFEIKNSNEILIRDSKGSRGRHNFIQNGDFSTNGCVFLRIESQGSRGYQSVLDPTGVPYFSEYHRSLATANLVDQSTLHDGWLAYNRGLESTGAGHTATQNVFWNIRNGSIISYQHGHGYIVGTFNTSVFTTASGALLPYFQNTTPVDFVEGIGRGAQLVPASLYESQLAHRFNRIKNAPKQMAPIQNINSIAVPHQSPSVFQMSPPSSLRGQ